MAKVIFEFDPIEDGEILAHHLRINDITRALWKIYDISRAANKHGDLSNQPFVEETLERIQELSGIIHEIY